MDSSIDSLVQQLLACPNNRNKFGIRATNIPDGSMIGRLVIEVVGKEGFRLLDLPRELRERIYDFIFQPPGETEIWDYRMSGYGSNARYKIVTGPDFRNEKVHAGYRWDIEKAKWKHYPPSVFSLLCVNRLIHAEATPVAYRTGQFAFRAVISRRLPHFIRKIGPSIKYLQEISLGNDKSPHVDQLSLKKLGVYLKLLKHATGLRKLYLHPDRLVLTWARQKAKDSNDPDSWACAFNKVVSNFLFDLRKSYKASNRAWKAADVIQFLDSGELDTVGKLELAQFEATWREIARQYLED